MVVVPDCCIGSAVVVEEGDTLEVIRGAGPLLLITRAPFNGDDCVTSICSFSNSRVDCCKSDCGIWKRSGRFVTGTAGVRSGRCDLAVDRRGVGGLPVMEHFVVP